MSPFLQFRPTFTDLRSEIERRFANGADPAELLTLVDQFIDVLGEDAIPLCSFDGSVTWLYRDALASTVSVVGDVIGFEPSQTRMQRLPGTDVFWFTAILPQNARISYAFAVDLPETADAASRQEWLANCRPDPFNRRRLIDIRPLRELSVLALGSSEQGAHDVFDEPADLAAAVVPALLHVVSGPSPAEWRRVWVVPPLDYAPDAQRYPVVVFLDGERYLLAGEAAQTMSSLQESQEIAPAIQVFVEALGSVDEQELFLTERLPAWVCECFAAVADPAQWVLAGASASAA
ncbi:MAG TPA: enterochelin esterase domain-containing protein, partial [Roseiflexaceae bacterium]|nr:enterochelin esterase domain-containing protein [Roseiflexaceae bacterium]